MSQKTVLSHFDRALQLHREGRLAEAELLYRKVLAISPRHADSLHFLGVISHQVGREDLAITLINRAIAENPGDAIAYSNLGEAFRAVSRLDEAITVYRKALQLKPDYPEALNNLGLALTEQGHFDQATAVFRKALELKQDYADAQTNLGVALAAQGSVEDAKAAHLGALRRQPGSSKALVNLGHLLQEEGELDAARGYILEALAISPESPEALLNLGVNCWLRGRFDEAETYYRQAVVARPNFADAHFDLGMLLLLRGRYEEGWSEYQWRWRTTTFRNSRPSFSLPEWDGKPINHKSILIHAEQGLGDTIQFSRFLSLVGPRSNASRVVFECQPQLVSVLATLHAPGVQMVASEEMDVSSEAFDFHLSLLDLPFILQSFHPLPQGAPYLHADDALRGWWNEKLPRDRKIRVGLAWAGSPRHFYDQHRSIPPAMLTSILTLPNVQFVNLQVEQSPNFSLRELGAAMLDFTKDLTTFGHTAGLISELDLIISVDTAVAHLAGALGRPVWTLLPFVPDWRWGLESEKTPWYPTMRLFRQSKAGTWEDVLEHVAILLRARAI
jgi:tetratricopeptide (TPR) repeat protein